MSGLVVASILEVMADKLDETGATEASMTLGYVTPEDDPQPDSLVPEIILRVRKHGVVS